MPCDKTSSLPYIPPPAPYPRQLLPPAEIHEPTKRSTGSNRGHPTPGALPSGGSPLFIPKSHGRNVPTVGRIRGTKNVEAPGDSVPFRPRTPAQTLCYQLANRSPVPSRPASPLHQSLRGDHDTTDITSPSGKKVLNRTLNPDRLPLVKYHPLAEVQSPAKRTSRALQRAQDGHSSSRSRSRSPTKSGRSHLEKTMATLNKKARQY